MFLLSILLVILKISSVLPQDSLKSLFPLYGLSEVVVTRSSGSQSLCDSHLKTLHNAIQKREAWALKMVDSSGTPVNGFLLGNNFWLGTRSQCKWKSKHSTFSLNSIKRPPFNVGFYMSLFKHSSDSLREETVSKGLIHLGLCLPSICTSEDLAPLLETWAKQKPLAVQKLYNFTMKFEKVRQLRPDFSWLSSPLFIIVCMVLVTAVSLTAWGTVYDIYVWKPIRKKRSMEFQTKTKNIELVNTRNIQEHSDLLNGDNNLNLCPELKIDNSLHKSIPVHVAKHVQPSDTHKPRLSAFPRLALCFSAAKNVKKIFQAPRKRDEAKLVHGLRFSAMIWLIWLYSVFYLQHYADNKQPTTKLSQRFSQQFVSDSTFSVDTLFFASGFLLAFKYYKDRRGSRKTDRNFSVKIRVNEFSLKTLRKFLRFTPLYVAVLGVVVIGVKSMRETSLFEIEEPADEICGKFWWRNIAYLNNLFNGDEICMSWSWYLSTDMQFFLLGMFILILSSRLWKLSLFVSLALLILSSVVTGYLFYGNRHLPALPPSLNLLRVLHRSPWTRVGPYLVGMFTGYIVVHFKGELSIKKTTLATCWLMWFLCVAWAVFGLYGENTSVISIALHAALSRTAWAFGLSWIITACCTGHAGVIKALLTFRGWIPFSKLSYSAYLLGPFVINLIISNLETATHLDFFQMIIYFFGNLTIVYFCSFFTSLTLEIPLATLGRRMVGKAQTQNQLNEQS